MEAKDQLIEVFNSLCERLGKTPTVKEFRSQTGLVYRAETLFGSYSALVTAAGKKPYQERRRDDVVQVSEETLDREYPRCSLKIEDGCVIVASDAHYWPGEPSAAHKALLYVAQALEKDLVAICMNGDVYDGARISRHPPMGWSRLPTVKEELTAVEERLREIQEIAKDKALLWTMGNHDARFENKLASQTPEYDGVSGFRLKEHFPHWKLATSFWINGDVVIKHRFKGGIHATHNNTLWSGKTIVTGHLHSLKVTPFSDYNGIRWGVDTGTLAQCYGDQFQYTEDNPVNWRSGFVVLTFKNEKLLWPEVVHVLGKDTFEFRGEIYSSSEEDKAEPKEKEEGG